jgi:hypothetical protein
LVSEKALLAQSRRGRLTRARLHALVSMPLLSAFSSHLWLLSRSRVFVCIFAGSACGILGLTGWLGMLFFAIVGVGVSTAMLLVKARMQPAVFLPSPNAVAFGSLFNGLMSYVLFWTLLYNVVHVY